MTTTSDNDRQDRCAVLVTGAGTDLGRAVSLAVAGTGKTVCMLDRRHRSLVATYDRIAGQGHPEPMMIEFDLLHAGPGDFDSLRSGLEAHLDALEGLVHCALWNAPLAPFVNSRTEDWQQAFERQVVRPMTLTRSLSGLLNTPARSSVVFPVLHAGRRGCPNWGAVGAAFAALENLCETLSSEWRDYDTRVNSLDVSLVRTALRKQFYPGETGTGLKPPDHPEVTGPFLRLLDHRCTKTGSRAGIGR